MLTKLFRPQVDESAAADAAIRLEKSAGETDLSGDPRRPMLTGIAFLVAGLGGFLVWAALAPLDEGIPAPGTIVVESQRKPVQHLTGGIVRKVNVAEAQHVTEGQVLIELDDVRLRAELEAVKSRYYGGLSLDARLRAERGAADRVTFPSQLISAAANEPIARDNMDLQQRFFVSRRAALQSELRSIDEGIASLRAQRKGLEARLAGRLAQSALLDEQLKGSRDLSADGYLPRNRLLEEERMSVDIRSQIADLEASIAANERSTAELALRRETRQLDFRQNVDGELTELARELPAFAERLSALRTEIDRTLLLSPVTGTVVGLQVQSVNAVVAPGGKVMDIVPENEQMLLEVRIEPHLIDRVHPGLLADVRFNAFQDAPQYTVEGRLNSVSADRLTDPVTHQPYYLGRIEVLPESMGVLKDKQLIPGMSAEAVIKTGERSLLDYLVRPLLRRVSTSMTEY